MFTYTVEPTRFRNAAPIPVGVLPELDKVTMQVPLISELSRN
jgi:hypothetical protein